MSGQRGRRLGASLVAGTMLALALAALQAAPALASGPVGRDIAVRYPAASALEDAFAPSWERATALAAGLAEARIEAAEVGRAQAEALAKTARARAGALEAQAQAADDEARQAREKARAAAEEASALEAKAADAAKAVEFARNPGLDAEQARREVLAAMTGKAFKRVPGDEGVAPFDLLDADAAPKLESTSLKAVRRAIGAIEEVGCDCGFVFADLESGRGIACNAAAEFYPASTFKAAFVLFILQQEGKSGMPEGDRAAAEAAIRSSSNSDYDSISLPRLGEGYKAWLARYGIAYDNANPCYPEVSARSLSRVWADLFQYLGNDAADATWFSRQLADTNRSYIRSGIGSKGRTVYNKAGWIGEERANATTDCAYIDDAGHPYLMVILTDQPYSDAAARRVSDLARALFATRGQLG